MPSEGKRLFIDYSKCIGCTTCEAVCKFTYGLPRIHMTRTCDGVEVPLYCQHCEKPMCMKVCPYEALYKDGSGAVLQRTWVCEKCDSFACMDACPFGAMFCTGDVMKVLKCDMCRLRREQGMPPACVEMCPTEAIVFVERAEVPKLQTEQATAAFKRVMDHIRPKLTVIQPLRQD